MAARGERRLALGRQWWLALAGVAATCLVSCGGDSRQGATAGRDASHAPSEPRSFSFVNLDSFPAVTGERLTPEQVRGQAYYNDLCWTCHGLYGHGDGPAARGFADPLPDLARVGGLRSDTELMVGMSRPLGSGAGGQLAPIWHALEPEEKRAAVAYVRSFGPPGFRGNPVAGRLIYATYCVHCHGLRGAGDGRLAPALGSHRADLRHLTVIGQETRVFATIRRGSIRHDAFMPEWGRAFSDQQLWDVVAYLQVFQAAR